MDRENRFDREFNMPQRFTFHCYNGPERRNGLDRRAGCDRRNSLGLGAAQLRLPFGAEQLILPFVPPS